MKAVALLMAMCASASAFTAPRKFVGSKAVLRSGAKTTPSMSVFSDATDKFAADYPDFAKYGWGPSTKAERWNGRHAMFGWVMIIGTLYAQKHGLFPPMADLSLKSWGTLATISGAKTISNQRAIILIAHVHALMISLCAAWAPLGYMDTLLLKPGEKDEEAYGIIPPLKTGVTKEAEIMNGRMAMMGLMTVVPYSLITATPILTVVDKMTGGVV